MHAGTPFVSHLIKRYPIQVALNIETIMPLRVGLNPTFPILGHSLWGGHSMRPWALYVLRQGAIDDNDRTCEVHVLYS